MQEYSLLHPDTEIIGQMVIDLENVVYSKHVLMPILKKYHMEDIKPDDWYSGQSWLNVLTEIRTKLGAIGLIKIGKEQIKNVEWPPEFQTMSYVEILEVINPVYQSHCRGTDTGEIKFEKITDDHLKIILRVFEPDDIWYGNIYQLTEIFGGKNRKFRVYYDKESVRRDHGGENTIIHIKFTPQKTD